MSGQGEQTGQGEQSLPAGNKTRAGNVPALERASGRSWQEWLDLFEAAGAAKLSHPEIARVALAALPAALENPGWWAQGAAIAFEQHAGLRVPGQSSTGDFRVGANRTVEFDRDAAIERWTALFADAEQRGHGFTNLRESRTAVRTFWRASLGGAGKFEIAASEKGEGRALLAIQHAGLAGPDEIEAWRAHWKARLNEL